ncbi:uncharacterized oxidoreductase YrbE-like [Amphiura filiformis]|uniref:uncharacterized oxidoreductase YrbE-like n=1 Tax=Amphiura filiformis TaxID=82378 RepID=UPI003B21DCEC
MSQKHGIALIGFGRMARISHFRHILCHPKLDLKYVVEKDTAMASNFVKQYRDDIVVVPPSDLQTVLEDKSVDATFICTPTDAHEEYIKASLNAGKAVFCEKPLTTDEASTQTCYAEAKKKGLLLFCGFNRRFDPSINSLHRRIQEGEIEQIKNIRTIVRDKTLQPKEYLKTSGGIFADSVVHEFDLAGWFIGGLPSVVYAQGHAWFEEVRELDDVDQALVVMKYPSGAIVTIDACREAKYGVDHRMEIHGSNGVCLQQEGGYPTSVVSLGDNGELRENRYADYYALWKDSFEAQVEHFVDALEGTIL